MMEPFFIALTLVVAGLGFIYGIKMIVDGVTGLRSMRKEENIKKLMAPGLAALARGYSGLPKAETEKGWRHPPADSTLGWRGWLWNDQKKCLESPAYHTLWENAECRVEFWSKDDAVRGVAGIHALWPVPQDWQNKECSHAGTGTIVVVGIVERFGHYVLGEDGWRAEWVFIRELAAHKSIIEDVKKAYPGITVHERTYTGVETGGGGASGFFLTTSHPGVLFLGSGGGGLGTGYTGSIGAIGSTASFQPGGWYVVDDPSTQIYWNNVTSGIVTTLEENAFKALTGSKPDPNPDADREQADGAQDGPGSLGVGVDPPSNP